MTDTTKTPAIAAAIEGFLLTLTFAHDPADPLVIDASELSDDIRHAAMMHGLKQKLVDAAAISRNPDTGRSASTEDKATAVREVADRLKAGAWNKTREGGNGGGNMGLLLAALVRLYDGVKTEAQLREYIAGLDEKQQAAVRATSKVAPIIAAIKAERDAKRANAVSGDDLLAGLDDVA